MPGLFVTATGTDVGKTYVTAGLIRAGRRAGHAMDALKPVMSGTQDVAPAETDAGHLLAALGQAPSPEAIARVAPWRFAAPLSPDMAAALEGRTLAYDVILAACRAAIGPERLTLIEGVGGVMVPLDRRHTILDLATALALPTLLVMPTGLGAISHALTAVAAMRGRGLVPAAIVLSETRGATVPLDATLATLAAFCPAIPLATVPRDAPDRTFDHLLGLVHPA